MGSEVYPGIFITGLLAEWRKDEIINYFSRTCNVDPSSLKVTCYRIGRFMKARVMGINMRYDDIRLAIAGRRLHSRHVTLQTPDFGIPRDFLGEMTFSMLQLHNQMKESSGFLNVLPILTKKFIEGFGGYKNIKASIRFDDVWGKINKRLLNEPGRYLYSTQVSRDTDRFEKDAMRVTQLNYLTVLEALQAVTMLNQRADFNLQRNKFITSDGGSWCNFTNNFGMGLNGDRLNVADLFETFGYIPLKHLNPEVVCHQTLGSLCVKCFYCKKDTTFVGVHPNLNWLATICSCDYQKMGVQWHNEDHMRFTLPRYKKMVNTPQKTTNFRHSDTLIPLIPNCLPSYASIEEFKRRAYANLKSEFRQTKRDMHLAQAIGEIKSSVFVEAITRKKIRRYTYELEIQVPKTKTWCTEGLASMHWATLKQMIKKDLDEATEKKKQLWTDYKEDKCNNWVKAVIHDIIETEDDNDNCTVVLLASLPKYEVMGVGTMIKIVPKPPVSEKQAMRKATKMWKNFMAEKERGILQYDGTVSRLTHLSRIEWSEHIPSAHVYRLGINLQRVGKEICDWQRIGELTTAAYVGVNIFFPNKDTHITARVLRVSTNQETIQLDTAVITDMEDYELQCKNVEFKLWVVRGMDDGNNDAACQALPAGYEDDDDKLQSHSGDYFDQVNFHDEDNNFLLDGEEEREDEDQPVDNGEASPLPYAAYDTKVYVDTGVELTDDLINNWIEEPYVDLGLMETLLTPGTTINHDIPLNVDGQRPYVGEECLEDIMNNLNIFQRESISKMRKNRHSLVQGPPGTGKTTLANCGIGIVNCKEEGLIIVTAPSNYACDLWYERLKIMKGEQNMAMEVVRMESDSRERKWWKSHRSDDDDPGKLHVAIREHPRWLPRNDDGSVNKELQKMIKLTDERPSRVPFEARKLGQQHKAKIRNLILKKADVIVTTVSSASDGRIAHSLTTRNGGRRKIAAIVLDEASILSTPSVLPLLTLGSKRLWTLGDSNQLKPTVKNQSAVLGGLEVSFMETLALNKHIQKCKLNTMLRVQYRMADNICKIVSEYMYNGELESSDEVMQRKYDDHTYSEFPEVSEGNVGIFTYTNDQQVQLPGSNSLANRAEVNIVCDIARKLARSNPKLEGVVIITMYDSQKTLLKKELEKMGGIFKDLEVATTDSFQGKEADTVIVSFVRSNDEGIVGFMRDHRRINVAISRAKHHMFLVMDVATFHDSQLPNVNMFMKIMKTLGVPVRKRDLDEDGTVLRDRPPVCLDDYFSKRTKQLTSF